MAEWRDVSGNKRAQLQREQWLKSDRTDDTDEATSLFVILERAPSAKVSTVGEMMVHIEYVLAALSRIMAHNVDRRRVRRSRFQSYVQRTAAMDSLCRRLSGGRGKEAVVVLGAAECSSGFGYFPGPVKELRRRLELHTRVVVLDEHYTSQRCSKCAFAVRNPVYRSADKLLPGYTQRGPEGQARREIHGVRRCPHRSCGLTWNRDVNAARNMRQVFLHMLHNGKKRPPLFQHAGALTR